jgi:4a-hydroxytetrahydrobiopterin dehydratase
MAILTEDEVRLRLQELPGWTFADDAISRKFSFAGFPDAVAFIVRLGFSAEGADHHPDLFVNYKRVTVTFTTHSKGGVTGKDFQGAKQADRLAESLGGV